jgi:ABC-2 type transport system permease protein
LTVLLDAMPATSPDAPHRTGPSSSIAGLGHLLRLALRRDRLRIALWVAGLVGVALATVESITGLYSTPAQLEQYARLVRGNTTLIVQAGPGYGLDDPTLGAVMMNELAVWVIIAVALMNIFVVVRHTRTEETTENAELTRAAPVGRYAGTAAALLCALVSTVAVAAGVGLVLALSGLPGAGTMAFAASLIGAGSVFASLAAVTSQIAATPRAALALSGVALVASFVARAVGDIGDGRLSWSSPIGSAQAIRAFADERWWVLLIPAVTSLLLVLGAVALQAHRDFGAGILAQRAGRPNAPATLGSPLGLDVRLQRASIVAWSVGLGLMGFFYGVVGEQAESIFEENPEMESYFAHLGDASITDAFLATSILMMALLAMGLTVSSVLRLRGEEVAFRADLVMAAPTSRSTWWSSHLAVTTVGTTVALTSMGAATGLGFAAMTGEAFRIAQLSAAALLMVPAQLVVAGLVFCLVAWWPQRAMLAWGVVAVIVVIDLFGTLLELPQWAVNVSPFQHVPAVPAMSVQALPIVILLLCAAALVAVGSIGVRRRDIG